LFQRPPRFATLIRPCTIDDGVTRLDDDTVAELHVAQADAAAAGRFLKFVPASGAASRMFRDLHAFRDDDDGAPTWEEIGRRAAHGDAAAAALVKFLGEIRAFPFHDELAACLKQRGLDLDPLAAAHDYRPIVEALLGPDGLDYARRPKGLIRFHGSGDAARTAFEEHLVEAVDYARDDSGRCRVHFTVSTGSRAAFASRFADVVESFEQLFRAQFDVGYSTQKPSTDTLAVDLDNRVLRDRAGRPQLRPGGHGALIENLADLGGDLIFIKNIDNVQPDPLKPQTSHYKRALGGYLVRTQQQVFALLDRLRDPDPPRATLDDALAFIAERLNADAARDWVPSTFQSLRAFLIDRLNRPLRVCGVVPNTGEPGGGPFWVHGRDGSHELQIVESAEIDPRDASQQEIWRSSTHFNPVDLVCGVRDALGQPFELRRFVDPASAMVSRKTEGGCEIKAPERPGL
jgi:hypothetical protein